MHKILTILSAVAILPFAADQVIGFAEKCETYKARVTLENIENGEKIAASLARAQALREPNESDHERAFREGPKIQRINLPKP